MNRFVLTAVLQLQAPRNLAAVVNQINRQLQGIQANITVNVPNSARQNINNLTNNINRARTAVNNFTSDIERAGYMAGRTLRRYAGFTAATGAFIQLGRAISSGIKDAIDYEVSLNKIRQVTGTAVRDLAGLNSEITKLSTSLGVSSNKIAQSALTLAQAGLSAEKTKISLEALAKTELSATFDDIIDTTEGAIAIFQQFNVEAKDLESVLGSINTVSAKFAVESADIITTVRRTGGAFAAAGGNLNELIALFTSVRQTTRESAESIATGFRTIFTRLQRVRTQDYLKTLGVELRDLEGKFVGPYEAVRRLSNALKQLDTTDPRFAQVVEELGGFRQVSKVIPLITKFDVAQRALNVAQKGGNSITEDAAKAQDTLYNKINKVKEEFEALLRKVASSSAFKGFIEIALNLASAFIKVADSISGLLPLLAPLAAVKIGAGLRQFIGAQPGTGFRGGIFGFASGGLVPGQGNSDSVPAMLTPGEFVIRKNAVKAIGAEKLAKMNGYSQGGEQKEIDRLFPTMNQDNVKDVKTLIAQKSGLDTYAQISRSITDPFKKLYIDNKRPVPLSVIEQIAQAARNEAANKASKPPEEKKENKQTKETISIGNGGNPSVGGLFVSPFGINTDKVHSTYIDLPEKASGKKAVLKGLVTQKTGVTNPSRIELPIGKEFVNGDTAARIRDDFPKQYAELVNSAARQVLPKAHDISKKIPISQRNSVGGYFLENIISAVTGQFTSNKNTDDAEENAIFDFKPATKAEIYKKLFGNDVGSYIVADAKYEDNANSIKSLRNKTINELLNAGSPLWSSVTPKHFATGGEAQGTDTVPAMLTPGEYVINKKAASRIGKSKLERLNKADKVRKFAVGGAVGKIASAAAENPVQSFAILGIMSQFVAQLDKSNKALGAIADGATQLATNFITLSTLMASFKDIDFVKKIKFGGLLDAQSKAQQNLNLAKTFGATSAIPLRQQELDAINKKINRRNIISNAALIGGTGLAVGGNYLQDYAMQQASEGKDSAILNRTGAALSMAGQGAALGAAAGPLGAALGGLAGAAIGAWTAWDTATKAMEKAQFDKKFNNFSNILDKVISGKANINTARGQVEGGIAAIEARRVGLTGADKETLEGQIGNAIVQAEQYLNKLAETSKTTEEFTARAGNTLKFFAVETSQTTAEVRENYKKQIDAQNKAREVDAALTELRAKEFRELTGVIALTDAFNKASNAANNAFNALDNFAENINGALSKLNITDNSFATGDVTGIKSQSAALEQMVGGAGLNTNQGRVNEIANLRKELPGILMSIRNEPALSGETFLGKLDDAIKGLGISEDIRTTIEKTAQQQLQGGEGQDVRAINEIFRDVTGASEALLRSYEPLMKAYEEAQNQVNAFHTRYAEAMNTQIALMNKERDSKLKLISVQEQIAEITARLNNTNVTFGQSLGFEAERNQLMTGGMTAAGLAANATNASGQIEATRQNLLKAPSAALITAMKEQEKALLDSVQGLEFLADVSARSAPYLKELDRLKGLREFSQGVAKTLAVGTAQEKRETARTMAAAGSALQSGTFDSVPAAQQAKAFDFLQQQSEFDPQLKKRFQEVFSNTLQQRGMSKADADKYAKNKLTPQEEKIAQALKAVMNESQAAQKALVELDKKNREDYTNTLVGINDKFIADLRGTFAQNIADVTAKANAEAQAKADKENRITDANKTITGLGIQDAGQAKLGLDALAREKVLQGRERDLKVATQADNVGRTLFGGGQIVGSNKFSELIKAGTFQKSFGFSNEDVTELNKRVTSEATSKNKFGTSIIDKTKFDEIFKDIASKSKASVESELGGIKQTFNDLGVSSSTFAANLERIKSALDVINNNGPVARNSGGPIPGVGNTDTVPAMLTPGEFVLRKDAVKAIGIDNLYAMNATGYAKGGIVNESPREMLERAKIEEELKNRKYTGKDTPITNSTRDLDLALDFSRNRFKNGGHVSTRRQRALESRAKRQEFLRLYYGYDLKKSTNKLPTAFDNAKIGYNNMTSGAFKGQPLKNYYFNTKTGESAGKDKLEKARERLSILNYHKKKKFANGGLVGGEGGGKGTGLTINAESLASFNQSIAQFANASNALSVSLNNFPREITLSANHKVEVIINGAGVLAAITPEIQSLVVAETKSALNNFIKTKLPDVGEIQ